MAEYDWVSFVQRWNREVAAARKAASRAGEDPVSSLWLSDIGATEDQLQQAETRLETRLPPSYRQFLATANGGQTGGPFIYALWPAEEIAWFRERNQQWIEAYSILGTVSDEEYFVYGPAQNNVLFRAEYLQTALQISPEGDSAVYLLNPRVVTPDGEWEAWFFANWLPGAQRYPSFWEMMQAEIERLRDLA